MKTKIISILALLLTVTQGAWAWSGSGTQADPYLITSASDWNQLVSSTTYFGSGKYYQLTADISVTSPVSRDASLQGTFDGNGHTITLTYSTSTKYDGLFPSIENLTVKNLHVAGTITTSNECAAGIAGKALGTNYFKNCRVSITISSSLSGKGYHGGLVAAVQGSGSANHVYIDNCSFDGGLTGTNTSYWCGFIGWSDYLNHVSISNSYFRPRNLNVNTDDFHPFSHVQQTYTNCLYTFYYSNQTPGDYSSEEGISSSASLSAYGVKTTLGSDNWKSVTESSVEYVVPIWQYTIFFDANGGSGAPAAQTKKDGTDLTLSSDVPTREGYNFFKWNTKADGTGINYAAGETYTVNTGVTLYAKWRANTYSVHFNGNGNTSGSMDDESFTYDEAKTLTPNTFSRTGYTFDGWATTADGDVAYTDGQSVSNLTAENGATVELFAHWSSNTTTSGIDWNPSTNSGTFSMPAYNVEVSTELWYKVDEEKTLDENITAYGTKSNFFLNRTLTANQWNTFASPFAIAAGDMEKYFGAEAKVRQLESTSVEGTVLTLNFTDANEIEAGQPYLVKPAVNVDFSADGKEFAGVNLTAAEPTPTPTTYVNFVPTLGKTLVEGNMNDILILNTSGTLVHPSAEGNMKGFRGYFLMHEAASLARAFRIDFGEGETTGIQPIRMENGTTPAEGTYDLSGRRIQGQPTQKGVYIQNGKKVIIK